MCLLYAQKYTKPHVLLQPFFSASFLPTEVRLRSTCNLQAESLHKPEEEELPVFEKKLAGAIEGIAKYPGSKPEKEHLEQISWDGLCAHLMQIFEQ